MAPLYTHSEWFIPTLEDLITFEVSPSRKCAWHLSTKKRRNLVRCSEDVNQSDLPARISLIQQLANTTVTESNYLDLVYDLASLILCDLHRQTPSHVNEIYEYWTSTLEMPSPTDVNSKSNIPFLNDDKDHASSQVPLATISERHGRHFPRADENQPAQQDAAQPSDEELLQLVARPSRELQAISNRSSTDRTEESPQATTRSDTLQPVTYSLSWNDLGVKTDGQVFCHGLTKKGINCRNEISTTSVTRIRNIKRELDETLDTQDHALGKLKELAGLIMCRRDHQNQAAFKIDGWSGLIRSNETLEPILSTLNPPQTPIRPLVRERRQRPSTTEDSDADTPQSEVPIWSSDQRRESPPSNVTTPEDDPFQENFIESPLANKTLRGNSHASGKAGTNEGRRGSSLLTFGNRVTEPQIRTRSKPGNSFEASISPSLSVFKPFKNSTASPQKAAIALFDKLKEHISISEAESGYIYGFRRDGCQLIKIGRAKSVKKRMEEWKSSCRYNPTVVLKVPKEFPADCVGRVESLVQKHLYKYRRREHFDPTYGHCNDGKGCTKHHKEWFEGVSKEYVEAVVTAWVRWITVEQPYDENGHLKPNWLKQIELFNKNAGGDIGMEWTKITLVKSEVKYENHEQVVIKPTIIVDKALDKLPKDEPRPIKKEVVETTREVEPENEVHGRVLAQAASLSELQRGVVFET